MTHRKFKWGEHVRTFKNKLLFHSYHLIQVADPNKVPIVPLVKDGKPVMRTVALVMDKRLKITKRLENPNMGPNDISKESDTKIWDTQTDQPLEIVELDELKSGWK